MIKKTFKPTQINLLKLLKIFGKNSPTEWMDSSFTIFRWILTVQTVISPCFPRAYKKGTCA